MPSFASSAQRLLRQLLGTRSRSQGPYAGEQTTLDGNTAVAMVEAGIAEGAALGGAFPADAADLAWHAERQRLGTNLFGRALTEHATEGARGGLAAACGLALSGCRATSFVNGPDLAGSIDLVKAAAGRRLPLVLHLVNRALAAQTTTLGNGHAALHLGADTGCFVLFAANVQEAVDFTLIARRLAEHTLTPGLVVMDGQHTALSAQEVRLPTARLVEPFLGAPADLIATPTPAQQLLFGEHRRRVPRWHDLDRPVLLGPLQPAAGFALGRVSQRLFLDQGTQLLEAFDASSNLYAQHTGRENRSISVYRMDDADLVLVAQGAAIETAEATADRVRAVQRRKVGVIGVRLLRPFPGERIVQWLSRGQRVCVLEQLDSPLTGDPPLLRELHACLDRATEGKDVRSVPGSAKRPRLFSVIYGIGGLPLRAGDLERLCREAERIDHPLIYLGVEPNRAASPYPKRQVLLDSLRRHYPDAVQLGLAGDPEAVDLRPRGAVTLAVHRLSGQDHEGLALAAAQLLRRIAGGQLRTCPALPADPWGGYCIDLVTHAPDGLKDPGDQPPVEFSVITTGAVQPALDVLANLGSQAVLVTTLTDDGAAHAAPLIQYLHRRRTAVYGVPARAAPTPDLAPELREEYVLGALFAVMLESGLLEIKTRRLSAARAQALAHLAQDRREAHLASFNAGIEGIEQWDTASLVADIQAPPPDTDEAPTVVHQLGRTVDGYDSLPRFWDQVGVLYRQGEAAELGPDPYLAIGAIPPRSSAFRDLSPLRRDLPTLDPLACIGCGACWSQCPEGAIEAVAASPAALINAGIQTSGGSALRPLASRIGVRIATVCSKQGEAPASIEDLLAEAYAWLQAKGSLPADRLEAVTTAFDDLKARFGRLPVAVTDAFFRQPEEQQQGTGELLFLAINPDVCKGCGICVSACPSEALTSIEPVADELRDARLLWQAWERLPDTGHQTRERVARLPEIGALAASLLERRTAQTLAGGDSTEPGSGERLALRLTLTTIETRRRPAIEAFVEEVQSVADGVARLIREILADALPADDLDALARGLASVDSQQTGLHALLDGTQGAPQSSIDALRMRRLVRLAQGLRDLAWHLREGRQGLGRAGVGVVLSADALAGGSASFPNNPFSAPATLALTNECGQFAAGLLDGQLRQAIEGFILVRKARLELESAADAARLSGSLDALAWGDLTPEERALCPPLLLVGNSGDLGRHGWSQIEWLLHTELPIKVLLLADLNLGLAVDASPDVPAASLADSGADLALLALARRNACIAQSSLAEPTHLAQSLQKAFDYTGPALLHLHAPSPARHGFSPARTVEQARLALRARVLPLFLYDPQGEGVFGSRLNLEGNPSPHADWADDDPDVAPNPATWALSEQRFARYFSPLRDAAPTPLSLPAYLALEVSARSLKTPFVALPRDDGSVQRLAIDDRLVQACDQRLHAWRLLRELAGLVTPFTARIEREARESVAAAHTAELAALRAEYEARIAALRQTVLEDTRLEMRERLLALTGYAALHTDPGHPVNGRTDRASASEV